MSQMEEQDKMPEKQWNEVEIRSIPGKGIQNNDSEDGPGSWGKMEKMQIMFTK